MERWENEESGKLQSLSQNLAVDLSLTQSKLEKLVNGFLDGIIEKETYLQKKDELIKQKIELEQEQSHFGQRAKLWVEPMRDWLETSQKAGKLALSNDYHDMKNMLEKIGTNRQVKDKEVGVELPHPFDILLKFKALHKVKPRSEREIKKGQKAKSAKCPVLSG